MAAFNEPALPFKIKNLENVFWILTIALRFPVEKQLHCKLQDRFKLNFFILNF